MSMIMLCLLLGFFSVVTAIVIIEKIKSLVKNERQWGKVKKFFGSIAVMTLMFLLMSVIAIGVGSRSNTGSVSGMETAGNPAVTILCIVLLGVFIVLSGILYLMMRIQKYQIEQLKPKEEKKPIEKVEDEDEEPRRQKPRYQYHQRRPHRQRQHN